MIARIKGIIVEGEPYDIYTFYMMCKFDKHFEKEIKKQIKAEKQSDEMDFDTLFNMLKNNFEEDE